MWVQICDPYGFASPFFCEIPLRLRFLSRINLNDLNGRPFFGHYVFSVTLLG